MRVELCWIQESKAYSAEEKRNSPYYCMILRRKGDKQFGMGFLMNKSLKVTSTNLVNERTATLTVTKKDKFKPKSIPTGFKIFRNKKEQWELSIINVHAPHMEKTTSQEKSSQTDDFYNDLQKLSKALMTGTWSLFNSLLNLGKRILKI